jgi:hypothetical protein
MYERLHGALLRCGPFDSHRELQAVFVDARIARWRHRLPHATDQVSLVNQVISFLLDKEDGSHENALVLFLRVLSDRAALGDGCHRDLAALAHELAQHFGPYATPGSSQEEGA